MKRSPALRELSVQHHHGLVQAHRALGAANADPTEVMAAAASFLHFWDNEAIFHFREEEELLLPVAARDGVDLSALPVARMLLEHASIRGRAMSLREAHDAGSVPQELLSATGALLEAHIRLEEREIFPLLEERLSPGALARIEESLRQAAAAACPTGNPERKIAPGE